MSIEALSIAFDRVDLEPEQRLALMYLADGVGDEFHNGGATYQGLETFIGSTAEGRGHEIIMALVDCGAISLEISPQLDWLRGEDWAEFVFQIVAIDSGVAI